MFKHSETYQISMELDSEIKLVSVDVLLSLAFIEYCDNLFWQKWANISTINRLVLYTIL